jgi:hypothetical protein
MVTLRGCPLEVSNNFLPGKHVSPPIGIPSPGRGTVIRLRLRAGFGELRIPNFRYSPLIVRIWGARCVGFHSQGYFYAPAMAVHTTRMVTEHRDPRHADSSSMNIGWSAVSCSSARDSSPPLRSLFKLRRACPKARHADNHCDCGLV